MSETLCTLRTKGGGGGGATLVETVLWQNPNPTTAISSALTVTLSDSVDNYEYIKLLYRYSTSDATAYSMIYTKDVFKQCQQGTFKAPIVGLTEQATDGSLYARQAYYVSTTSVKFGGSCYLLNSTSTDSTKSIPIQIVGIKKGRVPSYKTVKDFIYDKVFNSGLPEIGTYTQVTSRATISEGKAVVDAVARKVYVYFDFTMNTTQTSTSSWDVIAAYTSAISSYLPIYTSNSRSNNLPMITDDSSDVPTARFAFGYGTSNSAYRLFSAYGTTYTTGDHYIVYTEYTY